MTKPITNPHPIDFKYNKPILEGKVSKKEYQVMVSEKMRKGTDPDNLWKMKSSKIGKLKDGSYDYTQVIPRPIQLYRLWFLFLKLALELEENKVTLIIRHPQLKTGNRGESKKIRVNRKKYKGWDLDLVLTQRFDVWWKDHRSLFIDEGTKVLKSPNDWVDSPNVVHLCVDRRRNIEDLRKDIDRLFGKKNQKSVPRMFPINGKPRPFPLQDKYNVLIKVMDREKLTAQQIFDGKFIRGIPNFQETHRMVGEEVKKKIHYSSGLLDLLKEGKRILLDVCDGYFSKRPK